MADGRTDHHRSGHGASVMASAHPIHVRAHTWLVLAIGSLAGLAMFLWPLLKSPPAGVAPHTPAPVVFVVILPLVIAVLLAGLGNGGLGAQAGALPRPLSGVGRAFRL